MLTVTKPALKRLSRRLARKNPDGGMALRFTRAEGGWRLCLGHESDGDTAFAHDGRKVLLLDETVANAMAEMTLDAQKRGQRRRLRLFRNPARED